MTWQKSWLEIFGGEPIDRTSREVSVQDVLAMLITGTKPRWFVEYPPTKSGGRFLQLLWTATFPGAPASNVDWFVSEYELPVPTEWRSDIGLTYGCPDFACASGDRLFILELKTEKGSYRQRQMADYLRLARYKHPNAWTDVGLLSVLAPGARPTHDDRQQYGELTWAQVPELVDEAFSGDPVAIKLNEFLRLGFPPVRKADSGAPTTPLEIAGAKQTAEDLMSAAVSHALRIAPSVAAAKRGDRTDRGLDVPLASEPDARRAQKMVNKALEDNGFGDAVTVWLWTPASTGIATTPSGRELHRELRLAPDFANRGVGEGVLQSALSALASPGVSIAQAERTTPSVPGLYAVHADAKVWVELGLGDPGNDRPLYVGKAERTLHGRDVKTHFSTGKTGTSTLRRSLAALLVDALDLQAEPRNPAKPSHFTNYGLSADGDERLTQWMIANLRLAVWPSPTDVVLDGAETAVLKTLLPPLNLMKVKTQWSDDLRVARGRLAVQAKAWRPDAPTPPETNRS